jgi:hypothetical protein
MSNKLSALKAKKSEPKDSALSAVEAMIFGSMADTVASIGAVSAAKSGKDWSYSEVEVIPGIKVSARFPPGRLVEMDGFTLVAEMVNAADRVLPAMFVKLAQEAQAAQSVAFAKPLAHEFIGSKPGQSYSRKQATVAVVRSLLDLQGWKVIPKVNRWRSPVWLFPPVMLKWETIEEMVRDEVDFRDGSVLAIEDKAQNPLDILED